MINTDALKNAAEKWLEATPFLYFHVDNFF
jgi:hypothetical protein